MVIPRTNISPLDWKVPIVDPETGHPTLQFVRLWQQMFGNEEGTNNTATDALTGLAAKADKVTQIVAGAGLAGGGDLSANRTLDVGAGTGITVNANDVAIDTTAEAERIRDVIGAALVAGSNITITVNDAGDTITFDATGGGGSGGGAPWALAGTGQTAVGTYDFAVDGAKANVDFVGLAGYDELLIVARGLTDGTTGTRLVRVSVDNGASFYSASGDYQTVDSTGVENVATGFAHSTNSTAARTNVTHIINTKGVSKVADMHNGTGIRTLFTASTSAINAIRVTNSGGGNFTAGTIYVYGRSTGQAAGGWTLISEATPSGTGVVTFSSIPATYRDLRLIIRGRGDTAAVNVTPQVTFNSDTGANYGRVRMGTTNGSTAAAATSAGDAFGSVGVIPAASATASVPGSIEAVIYDYRGTTFHKQCMAIQGGRAGTTDSTWNSNLDFFRWANTAAITRVDVTLSAGNFVAGSVVSLYGVM